MNNLKAKHQSIINIGECIQLSFAMCIALIVSIFIKKYLFLIVYGRGTSMLPTLNDKDIIFVEKVSLYTKNIKRGQFIWFNAHDEGKFYMKRVIAVEGDEITIKDGKVYLNGMELKEDYLGPNETTETEYAINKYKIPEGYVYVLGDNRHDSLDSRILGPIKTNDIEGHAFLRAYPLNKIKYFK